MVRYANTIFSAFSCMLVAACGADSSSSTGSGSESGSPADDAVLRAYEALTAGDRDKATRVIADLDDAVAKDPSYGRATFYSAIMRFWRFGDQIALPSTANDVLAEATTMIDRFRKAQALLPDDDRAPAFGGLAKVIIGNISSDAAMRSEGMSDIDHGIEIFPSYSHFLRALASAESPPSSDDFKAVMPEMQAVVDTCGIRPNAAGDYAYLEGPLPSALRVCNDDGIVPHVWEGFLINYGDLLLKAGKGADAARAAYEGAKLAPRFAQWPFASALQDRIDHVGDRAALYADADAANDPALWMQAGHICTGCHQDQR
jgi:hypothetical protein